MRALPSEPRTSSPAALLVFHLERLTGMKLWLLRDKTSSNGAWEHRLRLLDQQRSGFACPTNLNNERWSNADLARSVHWLRTLEGPRLLSALVAQIDLDTSQEAERIYHLWWDVRDARVTALSKADVWIHEVPMRASDDAPWFSVTFDPREPGADKGRLPSNPLLLRSEAEKLRDHLVQNPTLDYPTISRWLWALVEERPKPVRRRKKDAA